MSSFPIGILLFSLGCTGSTDVDEPPKSAAPTEVKAPKPEPEPSTTRYVTASRLNLRSEPRSDAARAGRLGINTPVDIVTQQDDWVRVRVANGSEGWVVERFLGTERLTLDGALKAASDASGADALSWWQRAAALEPMSPKALTGLAKAYRDAGDEASAQRVELQLGWPEALFAITDGHLIEWSHTFDYSDLSVLDGDGRLTAAQRRSYTVPMDAYWSVLLDQGPPVPATVSDARFMVRSECSMDVVVMLELDFDLPEGRVPLVAARGTAPPSWKAASPTPAISRDAATAALTQAAKERGYSTGREFHGLGLAPDGDGWFGRAAWLPAGAKAEDSDGIWWPPLTGFDARVAADGTVEVLTEHANLDSLGIVTPLARRDITGDGQAETVWASDCNEFISASDGTVLTGTSFRCCGC